MWRLKRDGAKKDEEGGGEKKTAKPEEKKSVSDHASEASDEALKRAAADEKAKPEVREAAKKELEKRGAGKGEEKKTDEHNDGNSFDGIKDVRALGKGDLIHMGADKGYQYGEDEESVIAAKYTDENGKEYWLVSQAKEGGAEQKFKNEVAALKKFKQFIKVSGNSDKTSESSSAVDKESGNDSEDENKKIRKQIGDLFRSDDFAEKYLKGAKKIDNPELYKKYHPDEVTYGKTLKNGNVLEITINDYNDNITIGEWDIREDGTKHGTEVEYLNLSDKNSFDNALKRFNERFEEKGGEVKTTKKQREKEILSKMDDAERADYSRYNATADLLKHPTDRIRMNMHTPEIQEELKHLQKFVDDYEKNHKEELDYIRGDEEAEKKAAANKKQYIKDLKNNGSGKETSAFLSKNQEYFKDVLKKYKFDSFEDFEDWGADGADDDWDKYDKIFFQCLKKIPADKFPNIKKANSYDKLESVSDLIEEIRNNR